MIEWILEKLPVLIFVLVFVVQAVRGFTKMKRSREEGPPQRMPNELEEQRRQQEVQAEIRRRIAERRAGRAAPAEAPPPPPPVDTEPDPTAIPPLPEPLRRMIEQLEKKVQPQPAPAPPPPLAHHRNFELERQQRIEDELKALEEAKVVTARRAAHLAAERAEAARTEGALLTVTRRRLDQDLRDPDSLRRAFVLREVLGPPVGLR